MELNIFNTLTLPQDKTIIPFINIQFDTGTFTLNRNVWALLNIQVGDRVEVAQSKEKPEDWFISKSDTAGYLLRKSRKSDSLMFTNKSLSMLLARSVFYEMTKGRCIVSDEYIHRNNKQYYPILTKTLRNK